MVIPKDFKLRHGNDRLRDICRELKKLRREDYPNSGAVLLRVFLELAMLDYLQRLGLLDPLVSNLKTAGQLKYPVPVLSQLVPEIKKAAKDKLSGPQMNKINKALSSDRNVPFNVGDLNAFIHDTDLPSARDIQQFWLRTEPLFRLMLEQDLETDAK